MIPPKSLSADMAKALRVASIVAAQHLMPNEAVLFRSTRGQAGESRARLEFYWLLHTACGMSLSRVGKVTSGRDRSTVSAGVRRIEDALSDRDYRLRMERLAELAREVVELGAMQDEATEKILRAR